MTRKLFVASMVVCASALFGSGAAQAEPDDPISWIAGWERECHPRADVSHRHDWDDWKREKHYRRAVEKALQHRFEYYRQRAAENSAQNARNHHCFWHFLNPRTWLHGLSSCTRGD